MRSKVLLQFIAGFVFVCAVAGQQQRPADPRSRGGGDCRDNVYNCVDTPNPLRTPDTVWIEEMTWMDVRDALNAGKRTVIIPTGGIEPNGPWLALGKHNYVLNANCDAVARALGNALCAPILKFVPEGDYTAKTGHMASPGTITVKEETYRAILEDIARSLQAHGFENIILIGDSGGNQAGQKAVAEKLSAEWSGKTVVAHIPEYYDYASVAKHMAGEGLVSKPKGDGLHDNPIITLNMFIDNADAVRFDDRVKIGKATIDGADLSSRSRNAELAKKIVKFRATVTTDAIRKATAR